MLPFLPEGLVEGRQHALVNGDLSVACYNRLCRDSKAPEPGEFAAVDSTSGCSDI